VVTGVLATIVGVAPLLTRKEDVRTS